MRHKRPERYNHRLMAWIGVSMALGLLIAACGDDESKEDMKETFKVGFIYLGPPSDLGWTYEHDRGRQEVEAAMTDVETFYKENVAEDNAEVLAAIDNLVQQGAKMIFTTSYGFGEGTLAAAENDKYKDINFEHCSGSESRTNLNSYFGRMYQARFLAGYAAAKVLQDEGKPMKLCATAAFDIPEVFRLLDAYMLGAKEVDPSVTLAVMWLGSWYDPANSLEFSEEMISNQGCEVVLQNTDSTAALKAAQNKGKYAVGYHSDVASFVKETVITSSVWNWSTYYQKQIEAAQKNTWEGGANPPGTNWMGLKEGWVKLGKYGPMVTSEVQSEVDEMKTKIENGTFKIFTGPINLDGSVWLKEGENATDEDLWNMLGFVDGITELNQRPISSTTEP